MQTDFCLDRMKSVKHIRVDRMYQKKKKPRKNPPYKTPKTHRVENPLAS